VAREWVGRNAPVLLCTDSADVETAIRACVRDVVSRSKVYRQPGAGELHFSALGRRVLREAMIDMLLLTASHALIRYPPGSFFSFYPAVMRRWRQPPPATVYDLLRPHDPHDLLSPAVLV
jgi:hypothetical protein